MRWKMNLGREPKKTWMAWKCSLIDKMYIIYVHALFIWRNYKLTDRFFLLHLLRIQIWYMTSEQNRNSVKFNIVLLRLRILRVWLSSYLFISYFFVIFLYSLWELKSLNYFPLLLIHWAASDSAYTLYDHMYTLPDGTETRADSNKKNGTGTTVSSSCSRRRRGILLNPELELLKLFEQNVNILYANCYPLEWNEET